MRSGSGGSQRGGIATCLSIGRDDHPTIDATGIPQYGQEWMAREEHV
jgi:hypothetical protein